MASSAEWINRRGQVTKTTASKPPRPIYRIPRSASQTPQSTHRWRQDTAEPPSVHALPGAAHCWQAEPALLNWTSHPIPREKPLPSPGFPAPHAGQKKLNSRRPVAATRFGAGNPLTCETSRKLTVFRDAGPCRLRRHSRASFTSIDQSVVQRVGVHD